MRTFKYRAQKFTQRSDAGPPLLLFVAPASDIREWAGVPRKTYDYRRGFQRTLSPSRIAEVSSFFTEDKNNMSPSLSIIMPRGVV